MSSPPENKLVSLNESIDTLATTIDGLGEEIEKTGFNEIPNPESRVEASVDGSLELVGGTFSTDGGVHSSLESGLAQYIGGDISGGIEGGSTEVHALMKMEGAGKKIHKKLIGVSDSVTTRMQNILSIKSVMNKGFDRLYELVKISDNEANKSTASVIKEVQKALDDEFEKQLKALENILNLKIKPQQKDLSDLLKNTASFTALAEKLGVAYNDTEASDRLALAYTNLSQLGLISRQVKDSLITLKISLDKYKSIKNLNKLKSTLTESLDKIKDSQSTDQLAKLVKAMEILGKHQHQHDDIVECMKDKKCIGGSIESSLEGSMEPGVDQDFNGGDYTTGIGRVKNVARKSALTTRIKTYEKTLKELFKNFLSQLTLNFSDIRKDVEVVADQLGDEIPYNDDIKLFISIFEGFSQDIENEKLFYALIGLDVSLAGREVKQRFTDNLNRLIESLNVLKSHRYLADIKKQLEETKSNIDTYSDTVLGIKNAEEVKKGSADFIWTDKLVDPTMPINTAKIIRETIVKLKFYGNVSMIKDNLHRMTKEHVEYQTDYTKILGKSIGIKLSELNREYVEQTDRLNDKERGRGWLLETYNANKPQDQKIPRGLIETIYKLQYDAKVGLYKTVEAIDIYLMDFTENLSGNIEAVKELNTMLKQTEIISKWFDKKSGANMDELLAMLDQDLSNILLPANAATFDTHMVLGVNPFITGTTIKKVLEACKKSIDSIAVLKNIISMFIHIGDKFGNKTLSSEMYMSPNIMYKNLVKYIWVSAFTMGYGTAGGDITANINSTKKDKAGYEIEKGDIASFFHVKPVTLTTSLDILKKQENTLRETLKNTKRDALNVILALEAAGGAVARPPSVNLPILSEADLVNAIKTSQTTDIPLGANYIKAYVQCINTVYGFNAAALADPNNAYIINFVKYANAYELEKSIRNDIFVNEDKYFILALKGITAKILTVIASSNLLRQPNNVTNMIINPIRTIIGGKTPEVKDEAVELYIRLPLLVEFYKNIFENGNDKYKRNKFENDETETIAFIPEVGSKWSGLIQCIFDESKYINNGIYGVENMNRIIIEVNNIFKHYTNVDKTKLVRTVVLDLVAEINRRYGVLRRKDINEFYQIKKKYTKNVNDMTLVNDVNFDILDDTNEYEDAGPSSQFTENVFNKNLQATKTLQNDINIVKDFRDKIHNELFSKETELKELSKKSFVEKIKFYKNEISSTKNNESKVDMIIKAIDESSNINSHNTDINIMFHELVIYPMKNLQILNKLVYGFLQIYIPRMYSMYHNIQLDNDENVNYFNAAVAAVPADVATLKSEMTTNIKNPNKITTMINDYLNIPHTVAETIAYATNLNFIVNEFITAFDASANINSGIGVVNATLAGIALTPPGAVAIPEATAFGTAINTKIVEVTRNLTLDAANLFVNRSKIKQVLASFINENPALTETIKVVDAAYTKATIDVPTAADATTTYKKMCWNLKNNLDVIPLRTAALGNFNAFKLNKVTLVNLLQEFMSDTNLVELKFVSVYKFIINYTKLQEVVEKTVENTKYMISKFRNNFDKTIIARYEQILLEIEDKLFLKVLTNQDTTDDDVFSACNFELINNTFGEIINGTRHVNLSTDLYRTIMFNNNDRNTNPLSVLKTNKLFNDIFRVYDAQQRTWRTHDTAAPGGAGPAPIDFSIKECIYINGNGTDKRLLSKFNYLVYKYLDVFYDGSTKKIYNGLFNEFANKSQNAAVFGNNGIADIFIAGTEPNLRLLPSFDKNDHVLAESLGIMIKTLINRVVNVQMPTKYHLLTNLSEVSPNMVEKYKTFLPIFINLFESLINKCIIYKKILDTTEPSIINGLTPVNDIANSNNVNILSDFVGENQTLIGRWINGSQQNNTRFNNVLTNLIEATRALINDANNVLNEIGKKPQFFELKENFIKNFYNNTNKLPLMPMSTLSATLNNSLPAGIQMYELLFPSNTILEQHNKFLYGSNCVLQNKNLDNDINNYLWLKDAIKSYNNSIVSVNRIDISKLGDYLQYNNILSRGLWNMIQFNRLFNRTFNNAMNNVLNYNLNVETDIVNTFHTLNNKSMIDTISVIENSSLENSKLRISKEVIASSTISNSFNLNRANARLLNIIDLNIIPINVHALMREIPLINIYNYAFTYDNIIKAEFGNYGPETNHRPANINEMMTYLLVDPYYVANNINTLLTNTFTNSVDKLGTAKFLSDMVIVSNAVVPPGPAGPVRDTPRLNNKFIRNIMFLVNLQRVIMFKIKKEVERIDTKIVTDIGIINDRVTKYTPANPTYQDDDFEYLTL